MASCINIPAQYLFYPIGNTAPVSLTRDLPPDGPANILLLPCGDPRNILYTIFCEKPNSLRKKLDFTCCDYDPGILARNVLLLTMTMDGVADPTMWNIFFHMYLDIDSRSTLVSQSQKLAAYDSMDSWRSSPYSAIIKIGTDHTLSELRRYWELYADFYHPSKLPRLRELQAVLDKRGKYTAANIPNDYINPIVAAGPLYAQSRTSGLFTKHHKHYWETGTTFTDKPSVTDSIYLNSTFFYSRAGEGLDVSPTTDPMIPFHHAPLFGNANRTLTIAELVESARSQFRAWISAFRIATTMEEDSTQALRVVVRFILGDVLAVAGCLRDFGENTGARTQPHAVPKVTPWTARMLELNQEEYADFRAPTRFDVIDTSNIADYLGLLNIFLATAPLLLASSSSVLYTESVLIFAPNLRTEFQVTMFASLSAVAILMDLTPANAISGFTSRSNTHEDMATFLLSKDKDGHNHKFTWKRPRSGDASACLHGGHRIPIYFDTPQLIKLLHNIYDNIFKHDDPSHPHWQTLIETMAPQDLKREFQRYSFLCSSREAFVIFLEFIRTSVPISEQQWRDVVKSFQESAHFIDGHVELHALLFRYGLYTLSGGGLEQVCRPTGGRLSHWKSLPFLTRVFLLVPRAELTRLESIVAAIGLPGVWLRGYIKLPRGKHVFHSVDAAYGTVVDAGTAAHPDVSFHEDTDGRKNGADLVVSFVVLTIVLGMLEKTPPGEVFVELGIRNDPMVAAIPPLESSRSVFRACLEDTNYVHLMPEQPLRPRLPTKITETVPPQESADTVAIEAIGREQPVRVDIDDAGVHVASLAAKLEITNTTVQTIFADGAMPTVSQCSPCAIQIVLGGRTQTLTYPLPIVGSQRKLRLARKSSYIEVVVPVAIPFLKPDGLKMNPFPVVRANMSLFPWAFHRIVLDQLPVLDIKRNDTARLKEWYEFHLAFQLSQRECNAAMDPPHPDVLANIKKDITHMMKLAAGIGCDKPARAFTLLSDAGNSVKVFDTILFVDKVRYDVAAHTMVCDAFVVTLSPASPPPVSSAMQDVSKQGWMPILVQNADTVRAWKQMLPALAERCRTAWTHGANCEYAAQGRIPLDDRMMTDPLCGCGKGKDVEGMLRDRAWRKLAPFATRIALSPLFPVSYIEDVFYPEELKGSRPGDAATAPAASAHPSYPLAHANEHGSNGNETAASAVAQAVQGEPEAACERCRKKESADRKLSRCSGCRKTASCSRECQKSDWKTHKLRCKN